MSCIQSTHQGERDLSEELNIRIQQPDDMDPVASGFNVLIYWSGVTSRINYGGTPLKDQPLWNLDEETGDTWEMSFRVPLEEMP